MFAGLVEVGLINIILLNLISLAQDCCNELSLDDCVDEDSYQNEDDVYQAAKITQILKEAVCFTAVLSGCDVCSEIDLVIFLLCDRSVRTCLLLILEESCVLKEGDRLLEVLE